MSEKTRKRVWETIPHLRVGETTIHHDVGDSIARQTGVPMVMTACGQEEVTTLTTKRADLVRCEGCKAKIRNHLVARDAWREMATR